MIKLDLKAKTGKEQVRHIVVIPNYKDGCSGAFHLLYQLCVLVKIQWTKSKAQDTSQEPEELLEDTLKSLSEAFWYKPWENIEKDSRISMLLDAWLVCWTVGSLAVPVGWPVVL